MQVDLRIPSSKPVAKIVSFAQRCEDAGFSGLGFVDSHTFLRDVYVVMAQVLQNTGLKLNLARWRSKACIFILFILDLWSVTKVFAGKFFKVHTQVFKAIIKKLLGGSPRKMLCKAHSYRQATPKIKYPMTFTRRLNTLVRYQYVCIPP